VATISLFPAFFLFSNRSTPQLGKWRQLVKIKQGHLLILDDSILLGRHFVFFVMVFAAGTRLVLEDACIWLHHTRFLNHFRQRRVKIILR
jgi:hypothetical protein